MPKGSLDVRLAGLNDEELTLGQRSHVKRVNDCMRTKPLFLPLKAEWFEAFEPGDKDTEYRVYGPRWNEKPARQAAPWFFPMATAGAVASRARS